MTVSSTIPFHLRGNYAPVTDEITAENLEVRGSLPSELNGRYFRNGANPITGESAHWFLGDGMIHGVRLRDGKAEWYRNRWVQTPFYEDPAKPVIDLENFYTDINRYLRSLEEIVISTLNFYKISSQRSSGETGVWLEPNSPNSRKICAIGVKTSRWVTMHGFALNVDCLLYTSDAADE